MAWSTRQIAELAGTSVRAVRHYHEVGLLAEPERRSNGYKQYGVAHLVRVLRIKRLTELGFSLAQIAELGDADEHPEQELRALDAELAGTIEKLQQVRLELASILDDAVPTDLPAGFAPASARSTMSTADRSFIAVAGRVLGPEGQQIYADLLQQYENPPEMDEFDTLPPDADEQTRDRLAERFAPELRKLFADHPALAKLHADAPRGERFAQKTLGLALADLYNPAQLDVMIRAQRIIVDESRAAEKS